VGARNVSGFAAGGERRPANGGAIKKAKEGKKGGGGGVRARRSGKQEEEGGEGADSISPNPTQGGKCAGAPLEQGKKRKWEGN